MLKIRVIPILTFNGFALVKTKMFKQPRMVGNAVQAARVYNSRGVDELAFIDIFASKQNRKINLKVAKDVIKECFMPVAIGGGIETLEDINDLLQIGADKVILKKKAIFSSEFIRKSSDFFGSQCISIAVDVIINESQYFVYNEYGLDISLIDFLKKIQDQGAGEILLNSVYKDGTMSGFDTELYNHICRDVKVPVVFIGGGGKPDDFVDLFKNTDCKAVGAASIFHFTQFTPLDVKNAIHQIGKPVRI